MRVTVLVDFFKETHMRNGISFFSKHFLQVLNLKIRVTKFLRISLLHFTWAQQLNIWSMSFSILDHRADRKAGLLPVTGMDTLPGPLNFISPPWRLVELLLVGNCESCSTLSAFLRLLRKLFLALSNTDSTMTSNIPRLWNTWRAVPTYRCITVNGTCIQYNVENYVPEFDSVPLNLYVA